MENSPRLAQCMFSIHEALGSMPSTIRMKPKPNNKKMWTAGRMQSPVDAVLNRHHGSQSSPGIFLLLQKKETGSTFPDHTLSCKHTARQRSGLLATPLSTEHILQAGFNNCQIHKAKMQLPPGSHLSPSTLLLWEGNTGGPWHQAVRRTSPWPSPQAGQTFPKH